MATSGVTSGLNTVRDIATAVLIDILGVRSIGSVPSAAEADLVIRNLNWMLKTWQTDGLGGRWRREDIEIVWPAGGQSEVLDTDFISVSNAYVSENGIDRQLQEYSDAEYAAIPNKAQTGVPLIFNPGKTLGSVSMRVWPVPTVKTTIIADGERIVADVTALSETVDAPQEWTEAIHYGLAVRLCRSFKLHLTNPALVQDLQATAKILYDVLKTNDAEQESLMLQPDFG